MFDLQPRRKITTADSHLHHADDTVDREHIPTVWSTPADLRRLQWAQTTRRNVLSQKLQKVPSSSSDDISDTTHAIRTRLGTETQS